MASDERSSEGVDLSRAIYQAFGITAEEVEGYDPSYLPTLREARAREAAYRDSLPARVQAAAEKATEQMHADGTLPPGLRIVAG